jgi:MFS family permease
VVLFSVLLFSSLGSMLTERFAARGSPRRLVAALGVLLGVIVVFGLVSSHVLLATEGETAPLRILVAVALLAPLSLMMGMPFAMGMRMATTRPGATTAFMWGINGATSVCGSVFGLVFALFFGISTAFWVGALAYLVALLAMVRIVTPHEEQLEVSAPTPDLELDPMATAAPSVQLP